MEVKLIKTEADYHEALAELAPLVELDPALDTPEGDRLEVLGLLVEAWEKAHHPIELSTAIEAILFQMDQRGLTPADMVEYFGHRSRVTEVLNGDRELSKAMMRRLHNGLGISYDVLMNQPEIAPEAEA